MDEIKGFETKIPNKDILPIGAYPVVTQEKGKLVSGFTNNENVITDLPLILFGDHSCTFKYIDFKFVRGADGTVLLKINKKAMPKYVYYILNHFGMRLIPNSEKYERHKKYLDEAKIPLPPLDVQQKIVTQIEKIESKINILEKQLAMLPAEREKILKTYL